MSKLALSAAALFLQLAAFAQTPAGTVSSASPATGSCSPLPTINPKKGFLANFNNGCYALPMFSGGGGTEIGDLNAIYDQMYYQVMPGYELVVVGTFPNARFFSATVYDDHLALVSQVFDQSLPPLTSSMSNPYLPGATYTPNQQYGFTVSFGGGAPVTVSPGCQTTSTTIDSTVLDASMIHSGLTWTGYPNLPANFPPHETGANDAGLITVRKYIDISNSPTEVVIVRQLSDGCALPAQQAMSMGIIAPTQPNPSPWFHQEQINAHQEFSTEIEPTFCYPTDPTNQAFWLRSRDYIPEDNGAAAGIQASVQPVRVQNMLSGTTFMRIRFALPATPDTPCPSGCSLTGNEGIRYFSLSFQAGNTTLYSIDDAQVVRDPNGNVTLIIGMGTPPPSTVTAANYYTYLDLSKVPNYQGLTTLFMRDMLPKVNFDCSTFNVPFFTTETNPMGGYMGQYVPTVDYPTPGQIPALPVPPNRTNTCALVPTTPATACTLP